MRIYSFEKLEVWKKSKDFAVELYQLTAGFPKEERFGITDQIRRASASVPTNISERSSRASAKEQAYYCQIAYGSLMEVLNHLMISYELKYINRDKLIECRLKIDEISAMLTALRNSSYRTLPPNLT
jgi:four helix bundle protein